MSAIGAKYKGTCATTGRRYATGTMIRRTPDGYRWEIADARTDQAHAAVAQLDPATTVHLGGGSGEGCDGWTLGETLRADLPAGHPDPTSVWPGARQDDKGAWTGIVTVVTATSEYIREDGWSFGVGDDSGYIYSARARPATPDEAASVLAREEAAREQAAAVHEAQHLWKQIEGRVRRADLYVGVGHTGMGGPPLVTVDVPYGVNCVHFHGAVRVHADGIVWIVSGYDQYDVWALCDADAAAWALDVVNEIERLVGGRRRGTGAPILRFQRSAQ